MSTIVRILYIFLFLVFTQVNPYVHWHGHLHDDQVTIHLSFHFPDSANVIVKSTPYGESSGCNTSSHHDINHCIKDWDYTVQYNTYNYKTYKIFNFIFDTAALKEQLYTLNRCAIPPKLTDFFLLSDNPHRAPPVFA